MDNEWFVRLMNEGNFSIPSVMMRSYRQLGLNDQEWMTIMHLWHLQQEGRLFPTPEEMAERMSATEEEVQTMLASFVRRGWIDIIDAADDRFMKAERYSLDPLFSRLFALISQQQKQKAEAKDEALEQELFFMFENEFGRALSPIEYETLGMWLDKDLYEPGLIKMALKEAVLSGKLSFRYIDRILFEWQKNNIQSVEQAQEHAKQFRARKKQSKPETEARKATIPFYNWLD
ncbi:DnaD domain-containing protein [Aureibacillus halotolerans]|uniref:DNA replication protein DnaD n=1 Tax=Aureibacillus halotolerans TaxID=1508390 RepID=A0A4R6U6V5_9BACI|nr:DnaD domain-containing protein [Aureibacillus halotolerans]TDQ41496.1 DNA replication protein DnaD [Aureibacillus halotolerans]